MISVMDLTVQQSNAYCEFKSCLQIFFIWMLIFRKQQQQQNYK